MKTFMALARELETHGAPSALVEGCRDAACDEVGHAREIGRLADRLGGGRVPMRFVEVGVRSLVELAVDNAVEGCVNEVWAAMVAHWQATHAEDAAVRETMSGIARDEARHGDLARAVHEWAMGELSAAEQARVVAARDAAVEALAVTVQEAFERELVCAIGLPTAEDAMRLMTAMRTQVWEA